MEHVDVSRSLMFDNTNIQYERMESVYNVNESTARLGVYTRLAAVGDLTTVP